MPEKSKEEKDSARETGKPARHEREKEGGTWEEDQREKSYYYDDAHGYEIYNPDEDEEDEEKGE
jgi:hypothetical protein